jgi:hypothetical protein
MLGSNMRFIPDGFKEQMYYTNLFRLLFRVDTPEHVMPLWESLVPNIYSPSVYIIDDFMEFISTWNMQDYFVRLWSDLLTLGLLDNRQHNQRILERYLVLLTRSNESVDNSERCQQYANIVRQIIKRFPLVIDNDDSNEHSSMKNSKRDEPSSDNVNEPQQRKHAMQQTQRNFQYNGQLLSYMICLLSQANDYEASWSLFEFYMSNRSTMVNQLNEHCLMLLMSVLVQHNQTEQAFAIIDVINEWKQKCLGNALDMLNRHVHLTFQDRQRLRTIQKNSTVESARDVKLI